MTKPKKKSELTGGLFANDSGKERPSPLSLVDQTPKVVPFNRPEAKSLVAQTGKAGRLVDQSRGGYVEDPDWGSRSGRTRRGGRYHPDRLVKVDAELRNQKKIWQDFVDASMAFWLAMGAPDLGVWSPTLLLCSSCGSKDIDLNTTTTTQVVAQNLPGFPVDVLEMPNRSRHSPEVIWRYAQSSYLCEIPGFEGIKRPTFFTRAAVKTGQHDAMIDSWLEAKRAMDESAARRLAETVKRDEERRQKVETYRTKDK